MAVRWKFWSSPTAPPPRKITPSKQTNTDFTSTATKDGQAPNWYRGGGGGGSSSSSDTQAQNQQQAEAQRQAEIKKQQEAEKKRQEEQKQKQQERQQKIQLGTIGGQLSADKKQFDSGTIIREDKKVESPLHGPGTIYQHQTGSFSKGGRTIPTFNTYTVSSDYSSKPATLEERGQLQDSIKSGGFNEIAMAPERSKLDRAYGESSGKTKSFLAQEFYDVGKVEEFSAKGGTAGKIAGGIATGLIPSTKGGVFGTVALFGIGAGASAGLKGGATLLGKVPKVGRVASKTFTLAGYGTGAVLTGGYVISAGGQFNQTEGAFGKSQILGRTTRELTALGFGAKFGSGRGLGKTTKGKPPKVKTYSVLKPKKITKTPLRSTFPLEVQVGKMSPSARQKIQLKRFQSKRPKQKPYESKDVTFLDDGLQSKVRNQRNRLRSGADVLTYTREGNFKIIEGGSSKKSQPQPKPLFEFTIEKPTPPKKSPPTKSSPKSDTSIIEQTPKSRQSGQQQILEQPKVVQEKLKVVNIDNLLLRQGARRGFKQRQKIRTKQKLRQRQKQRLKEKTSIRTREAFAVRSRFGQSPRYAQRQTQAFKQPSALGQPLSSASALGIKQLPLLRQTPVARHLSSLRPKPKPLRGGLPPFGLGGLGRGKGSSQRVKQLTKYQPSFTASALRITAVKAPRIPGLSVRPLVVKKRVKVQRRRKRKK